MTPAPWVKTSQTRRHLPSSSTLVPGNAETQSVGRKPPHLIGVERTPHCMATDVLSGRHLQQTEGVTMPTQRRTRIAHTPRCVTCSVRLTPLHLLHLALGGEGCFHFEAHAPPSAPAQPMSTTASFQHPPDGRRQTQQFDRRPDGEEGCHPRSLTPLLVVRRRMPARMRTLSTHAVRMARLLFVKSCQFRPSRASQAPSLGWDAMRIRAAKQHV